MELPKNKNTDLSHSGDEDGVLVEIPSVRNRVLPLQPLLASPDLLVAGGGGGLVGAAAVGGGGGEVEGGGPAVDRGGVLGHVEAPQEGDLGDDDEGDD